MAQAAKYRPIMCQKAIEMGKIGYSKAQIASKLDISRETLRVWGHDNPAMSAAIKEAHDHALAWWEQLGIDLATGVVKGNATAWLFSMKNRFRDEYADVHYVGDAHELVDAINAARSKREADKIIIANTGVDTQPGEIRH